MPLNFTQNKANNPFNPLKNLTVKLKYNFIGLKMLRSQGRPHKRGFFGMGGGGGVTTPV